MPSHLDTGWVLDTAPGRGRRIFYCTNQLEMVYSGANLSLKVNFEKKVFDDFNPTQSPFCIPNSIDFNNKTCFLHIFTDAT